MCDELVGFCVCLWGLNSTHGAVVVDVICDGRSLIQPTFSVGAVSPLVSTYFIKSGQLLNCFEPK